MTKKIYDISKVRIGKVYLHHTFAAVEVHSRITQIEDVEKGIFMGVLLRENDVDALRNAGVPHPKNVLPLECEGVVYGFQIIREIRGPRKKSSTKRKGGRRRIVRPSKNSQG